MTELLLSEILNEMKHRSSSEKGQISVMVGVMMMTFITFFAFVINVGMLVNAKINLQNAADLAAYAGASVQARQLTQISYLNYEMRRQWKKFLFRIYVLGNMSLDGFADALGASDPSGTPMQYIADRSDPGSDRQVPMTCVMFNNNDNYCHLAQLPAISIPTTNYLDSINQTLVSQLQSIENARQSNCKAIGLTNILLTTLWVFNADPQLKALSDPGSGLSLGSPDQLSALKIVQNLAEGLGIVPQELLLKFRIDTLASYVNAKAQMGVQLNAVQGWKSTPDPASLERTIQAFYSAYYTLGNHTYPYANQITLDELLPGNTDAASALKLKDITQKFDTFALDFSIGGQIGGAASSSANACQPVAIPIIVSDGLPVGVYKDPTILTYYAIRLTAKARVLFSPFGDIQMKAYSAAQPFGSRIGPSQAEANFGSTGSFIDAANGPGSALLTGMSTPNYTHQIPNLPIREGDSSLRGKGWDTKEAISAFYQGLTNTGGITQSIDRQTVEKGYQIAMAPNPWEAGRYNIINDLRADDHFVQNFGPSTGITPAAIWAPLFPSGQKGNLKDKITAAVSNAFSEPIQGNTGAGSPDAGAIAMKSYVTTALVNYIQTVLPQGGGDNGEGLNMVRLSDPFHYLSQGHIQTISGPPALFLTDAPEVISSWGKATDGNPSIPGRTGYSVKFVSFSSLQSHKNSTNGSDAWTNSPTDDGDAQQDIPQIKH